MSESMANLDSHVSIILDPSEEARAAECAEQGPLWLLNSPLVAVLAEKLRQKYSMHSDYVTVFNPQGDSAEDILMNAIPVIEEHHPEMTSLTVIGVYLSRRIRSGLGDGEFLELKNGFVFIRHRDCLES